MNDPIVDEVRRVRDANAAKFNYNLDAIFQDIKEERPQVRVLSPAQGRAEQSGAADRGSCSCLERLRALTRKPGIPRRRLHDARRP